jgi:uncharacterized protein
VLFSGLQKGVNLPAHDRETNHDERVARFLEFACWDHRVHSQADHRMYDRAAQRLLSQHPEIARDSLYTAIVCGDVEEFERILTECPEKANAPGGTRGWPPLLYLCFTRFSHPPTIDNAPVIARALLDRGADPNAYYMAVNSRYSALVGIAGEGEQDSPRQPQAKALFQLLLERGAQPFDLQVLYNTHFRGDVLWWLELVYAHTVKTGQKALWDDPNWSMFDMRGHGTAAYLLFDVAVNKNDVQLAEWLLAHGASPNAAVDSVAKYRPKHTLYQQAVLEGLPEMTDVLGRHGAKQNELKFEGEDEFAAACFRLDRQLALRVLEQHPEYLESPEVMFSAARRDRADVVALLLDLGVPIEVEGSNKKRTLHEAAAHNALRVARLLLEHGADVDPVETNWDATPIGWAAHVDHIQMIELLSGYSRDIWTLSFWGYVDRLRQVLKEAPELAKKVDKDGITPLWWLPDDEAKALEIVQLFLAYGADPSRQNRNGRTAADWAATRGMLLVAQLLRKAAAKTNKIH